MIKKILVPYNGSAEAKSAFNFALDLAQKYQTAIQILAVATLPDPPGEVETAAILENATDYYKHQFTELRHRAKEAGLNLDTHIVSGHAAEQIIHFAEKNNFDVIVMGHQSRSKLGRWLIGSVTDRVVDHAPCTVIVVKRNYIP